MADDVFFAAGLVLIFATCIPLLYWFATGMYRRSVRDHVWWEIDLEDRVRRGHSKPCKNNHLGGLQHIHAMGVPRALLASAGKPVHVRFVGEKLLFRYQGNSPWPYRASYRVVASREGPPPPEARAADGAHWHGTNRVKYELVHLPVSVPGPALAVFAGQKVFQDAYGGREKMMVILFVLFILVLVLIIGLYAKG